MEGENLRQAKARIESTMDLIIKGFEHQLDELYKADAMDVDSDIRVMETMLGAGILPVWKRTLAGRVRSGTEAGRDGIKRDPARKSAPGFFASGTYLPQTSATRFLYIST